MLLVALVVSAALAVPRAVDAQRVLSFGGAEARLGVVAPENARIGTAIFGEVDLGYLRRPPLRALVGVSRYVANIDREPGDDEGSYIAHGLWLSGRYDLFGAREIAPYVRAGLALHRVSADAFDRDYGALLSGTYLGAGLGVGVRYAIDPFGRFQGTAELRSLLANNIGHTAFEVGLRYQRRGILTAVAAAAPVWSDDALRPPVRRTELPPAPGTPRAEPGAPRADTTAIAADTAAQRMRAEAAELAAAEERAAAEARARREELLAAEDAERERAAAEAARAAASEAMLRQGLLRAAAAMRFAGPVQETPVEFVLTLSGDAFAGTGATLSAAARSEVRVLATVLAGYPGHIISVEGHAAAADGQAAERVSQERAATLRAALIAEGVDPLWISAMGWGTVRRGAVAAAPGRRVEIRVEKDYCATVPSPGAGGRLVCAP